MPVAGAEQLFSGLLLPDLGRGPVPGETEPVPSDPDAPARVGESDGVQITAPAAHHGFPDAAAGFHQIDGLTHRGGGFRHVPLHTFSL